MAYDKAKWHSDAPDFPSELEPECGGTHIGIFLAWAIHHGLEGEDLRASGRGSLVAVRARQITGREVLFRECDGALTEDDLNEQGNAFASWYYGDQETFGSVYTVEDAWSAYDRMTPVLERRFAEWKQTCP